LKDIKKLHLWNLNLFDAVQDIFQMSKQQKFIIQKYMQNIKKQIIFLFLIELNKIHQDFLVKNNLGNVVI